VDKDGDRIERCLAAVDAYRASGQKASEWAAANGVRMRDLASWCAHAKRWRERQQGIAPRRVGCDQGGGFVAVPMGRPGEPEAGTVQVDWPVGAGVVRLHWPLEGIRALAALLREVGR
jgi:hypothetical protein